jgi:hypothetical protein
MPRLTVSYVKQDTASSSHAQDNKMEPAKGTHHDAILTAELYHSLTSLVSPVKSHRIDMTGPNF